MGVAAGRQALGQGGGADGEPVIVEGSDRMRSERKRAMSAASSEVAWSTGRMECLLVVWVVLRVVVASVRG